MNKKLKTSAVFLAVVILGFVVFIFKKYNFNNSNADIIIGVENQENSKLQPEDADTNNNITYSFEGDVFTGLLDYAEKNDIKVEYNNNYDFGVFIESINGIKNGDEGKYWQYYLDGVLGDIAADKKIAKDTEKIEWRFEIVPF